MTDPILLPVGRFVSGSLTEVRTTGHDGKPLPEEKQRFEFGVAVRKDDPALPGVFQQLQAEAMINHGSNPAVTQFQLQGYSWKVSDGDRANSQGVKNDNTTGCYVFWFSSSYPPRTCDNQNTPNDPASIKRGYFVDVVFNAKNNGATGAQAGIYLNPEWVRLIAYGEEITAGRSAADAFGNAPAPSPSQLPPGASATPVSSTAAPGMSGNAAPASGAAQPTPNNAAPAPAPAGSSPTASPSSAPQPAHDIVQNATGQPGPNGGPLPGLPS